MDVCVKLPAGPLISYLHLSRLIADAVCPIKKNLEGVNCVWAKTYFPDAPSPYCDIKVPHLLDDVDRQEFAKILPKLPSVRYPMSEEATAIFMEAYMNLPGRPIWRPHFVTAEMIFDRELRNKKIRSDHIEAMRNDHRAGWLVPVNANHVPLEAVELGAHLTRSDALAYLNRRGLPHDEEAKTPEPQSVPLDGFIKGKLAPSDREEIVRLHKEWNAKDKTKVTKLLAEKFKISTSMVRRLVREDAVKKKSIWPQANINYLGKKAE